MRRHLIRGLVGALVIIGLPVAAHGDSTNTADAAAKRLADSRALATFEGRTIDLRKGWGAAKACLASPTGTVCYRDVADFDAAFEQASAAQSVGLAAGPGGAQTMSLEDEGNCSASTRLYEHTGFTGRTVGFLGRWVWYDLDWYGFSYQASSYRIGACDSYFEDGWGWGYPGPTWAWASASSLYGGWNDTFRWVYIY